MVTRHLGRFFGFRRHLLGRRTNAASCAMMASGLCPSSLIFLRGFGSLS